MRKIVGFIIGICSLLLFSSKLSLLDLKPFIFPRVLSGEASTPINSVNDLYKIPESYDFTLAFTGDIMLGRQVNINIQNYQDQLWPFSKMVSVLSQPDLTIANLESPLTDNCSPRNNGMVFCGRAQNAQRLYTAGIDLLNLANNHTLNQGQLGLAQTKKALSDFGLRYYGDDQLLIATQSGTTIGFLGFTDLTGGPGYLGNDLTKLEQTIKTNRTLVDFLVVTFHFGNEYQDQPNARQKQLAALAIDSGADLVVGHHPHHLQPPAIYKGKLILYSLGNFVFDQMWSEKTKEGALATIYFKKHVVVGFQFLPTVISDYGLVTPADQARSANIFKRLLQ